MMCSYNRINGVYASQDPWLLTTVLRDEWGYTGLVVSDWGAVSDRVASLSAGLDLQMPSASGITDREIVDAIEAGTLDESILDVATGRMLELIRRTRRTGPAPRPSTSTPTTRSPARRPGARSCCSATRATCSRSPAPPGSR
ncbi:glycoside hydrolase family 3 N-terminal domain-containing protein [Tessaracoccus coleopterorum]|uniref:glycoside hydrolase family 3 N-terminal domain-containing protein n=1 Tax=Tessaracoccus coleopterorum TaxID=2714950 RepID=UPI002F908AE3